MLLMTFLRSCFVICVPLFLMLTGYLVRSKTLDRAYCRKLLPILLVYLLSGICCTLYRLWAGTDSVLLTLKDCILGMFSFSTVPYSWYVEMYIGLFFLIPFLNTLYDSFQTRREKQRLVVVFLFLTAIPGITNGFRAAGPDWWLTPSSSDAYHPLLPQWWEKLYPITYFYLGRWLREYPVNWKLSRRIAATVLAFAVSGLFNCYRSYGNAFVSGPWQDYESLLNVLPCVTLFLLFANADCSRLPEAVKICFARVSEWSFGAYLVSWIFDRIFYARLNAAVPSVAMRLEWFPLIVPAVFLCSVGLSALLNRIASRLLKHR